MFIYFDYTRFSMFSIVSASRPYSLTVMQVFLIAVTSPAIEQGQNAVISNYIKLLNNPDRFQGSPWALKCSKRLAKWHVPDLG